MRPMIRIAVLGIALVASSAPAFADAAADPARWPSELEQQLVTLDAQLVTIQQNLFTAKQTNNVAATELYTAEFNTCQSQRMAILQSMGVIQPDNGDGND